MTNAADFDLARRRGWAAFINGRARTDCPYENPLERYWWLYGYDAIAATRSLGEAIDNG